MIGAPRPADKGRRSLELALSVWAAVLLVLLFATVLAGIVSRALDDPLSWTDEGARLLMVWLACAGWMLAGRRRRHVRIRFFQDLLPGRARRVAEAAVQVAMGVFGAVVAAYAVVLVRRNASLEATALPVSVAWFYVPLLPAGVALVAEAAGEFRAKFGAGVARGGPPPPSATPMVD